MNTQLLMSSGDIETICTSVVGIVIILAVSYLIQIYLKWLLRPRESKSETPIVDKKDSSVEYELKRQERVRSLMREICDLTKDIDSTKGNDGLYNDVEAQKLFKLYQEIDEHIKLPIRSFENEK